MTHRIVVTHYPRNPHGRAFHVNQPVTDEMVGMVAAVRGVLPIDELATQRNGPYAVYVVIGRAFRWDDVEPDVTNMIALALDWEPGWELEHETHGEARQAVTL